MIMKISYIYYKITWCGCVPSKLAVEVVAKRVCPAYMRGPSMRGANLWSLCVFKVYLRYITGTFQILYVRCKFQGINWIRSGADLWLQSVYIDR